MGYRVNHNVICSHVSSLILNTHVTFNIDKNENSIVSREFSLLILAGPCYEKMEHCDIIICS